MTYDAYRYIFLGASIACGIMIVISGILFFALKIPRVIGDLTGHTARKAIEDIRKQNVASGDKSYKSSAVNLQRGKLTDKITQSGKLIKRTETPFGTGVITERLKGQQNLSCSEETSLLEVTQETTVLYPETGETTVLATPENDQERAFFIEYEITFIHTNEVIT